MSSISKNHTDGNNSSDFPYRRKVLRGLQQISDNTKVVGALSSLISTLITAVRAHQEFELKLVRDDANDQVVVQRNEYDEETGSWSISYVDATGAAYTLVGNPEYMDPESVLITIDGVLDQIKLDTANLSNLDAALTTLFGTLGQKASVGSAPVVLSTEQEAIIDAIKTAVEGTLAISATSLPLPTGASTSALQTALNALITTLNGLATTIDADTSKLADAKTPTSVITDGSELPTAYEVTIPVGATEISVFNNGTVDATVNGIKCPAGVTRTFGFKNEIDTAIVCLGSANAELIIDYMA